MFSCLAFSKDRPMQCDCLIRSIRKNIPQIEEINILYCASNDFFQQGYDKLIFRTINDNIIWHKEYDFNQQTKTIVNRARKDYHICLTDDDVSINPITNEELQPLLDGFTDDVSTISFHHNKNITYCGSAQTPIALPKSLIIQSQYIIWNWLENDAKYDWGYPNSLIHLYKTEEFKQLINPSHFFHPNSLEGKMNLNRNRNKPFMRAFSQSKFFNVANNYVKSAQPVAIDPQYSIEHLNKMFLDGDIINIDVLQHMESDRIHGPLHYEFIKE